MSLHTNYRPQTLDEIQGNEPLVESLKTQLAKGNKMPQCFLFTGPSGCGKTTIARIIKNELNVSNMDFIHHNASAKGERGIDVVHQVAQTCRLASSSGGRKIYMFEEAHQLTGAAGESFLDLIEEPPKHVVFIFCTTNPEKLKTTFKRRCLVLEVKPLISKHLIRILKDVAEKEKKEVSVKVLKEIINLSNGSPGEALSKLELVIDINDDETAIQTLSDASHSETEIKSICQLLCNFKEKNSTRWSQMQKLLKNVSGEPESIRYAIAGYIGAVMLSDNMNPNIPIVAACFCDSFIYGGKLSLYLSCYHAIHDCE